MLEKIITDADFEGGKRLFLTHIDRRASRGVLLSSDGRVALMYTRRLHFFKLPGGGVKRGESDEQALHREILEETGYKCRVIQKLGTVEEHKVKRGYRQISSAYVAQAVGQRREPKLTSSERRMDIELRWYEPAEALAVLERELANARDYGMKFLSTRDCAILRYAYENCEIMRNSHKNNGSDTDARG